MEEQQMSEMLQHYIVNEAFILIPVLWVIGYILKQTPKVPDWVVVYAIAIAGVIGGLALIGTNANGVIQGILVAGVSVMGHQAIHQFLKKNK